MTMICKKLDHIMVKNGYLFIPNRLMSDTTVKSKRLFAHVRTHTHTLTHNTP